MLKNAFTRFRKIIIPVLFIVIIVALQLALVYDAYHLDEELGGILKSILGAVFIGGIAWLFIVLISIGKDIILENYDINQKDNLKARKVYTQFSLIQRIINFLIILISVALILMNFDGIKKIGVSLLASAGIAGIILGFAAQKLLGTVLAGFQIAITQPIRIEDVVIVENEWGWIEEITLTYVVVRIWDKRRLIVPTPYFIENSFQNWTRNTSEILGSVFIYTDYNMPMQPIREELKRILDADTNWDGQTSVLQVTNATEKTVEVRVLVSAKDSPTAWDLRVAVREKLIAFIQENYPQCLPKTRIEYHKQSD